MAFSFSARRVVTVTDGSVAEDGEPGDVRELNGCRVVRHWQTETVPTSLPVTRSGVAKNIGPLPAAFAGTRFYTAELPPGVSIPLHATSQVDYIVVIKGRLTLVLESSEVELHQGDAVVQCGNMHGWTNRGDQPCVLAVVAVAGRTAP